MQELSFMDNKTFDKAVTIIIDILQEIYLKGGLAYVEITKEYDDAICYYRNLGIEILQNCYLPDISAVMLELAINEVENNYNISMGQKNREPKIIYPLCLYSMLLKFQHIYQRFHSLITLYLDKIHNTPSLNASF